MSKARGTILVIEDNPSIRFLLEEFLSGEGYAVVTAADGRAGLEATRAHRPDVVLLDMKLPQVDGWQFMRELRGEFARTIPVLVTTAAPDARRWADEVGADGVIAKPYDLDQLLVAIDAAVAGPEGKGFDSATG